MIALQRTRSVPFGWAALLPLAALGNLAALLTLALTNRDPLAIVLSGIVLLGLALRRGRGWVLGSLLLAGVMADQAIYTVVGAIANVIQGEGPAAVWMPALIAVTSVGGLIAAVGSVVQRRDPMAGQRIAPWLAQGLGLGWVLLLVASVVMARGVGAMPAADVALESVKMAYSQEAIVVPSGAVTLELANHDLFWHTFTVDALGVDLLVTENGTRQVTFDAPPGSYRFYCAIPGHEALGMAGALVVEPPLAQP